MKQLESQFVQSQKMQAIGQLAGGVAHDFNNLLTAISGHCDLLLLRHDPDDPDHADLQQIAQNANRAAALVGQLLAFSRKQNLQPQVLDLRLVLADHAHLLKRLMGERVTLSYSASDDLPLVRADRRQLEQVVMNLVVNARDAMPNGGEIRVSLRAETLAAPLAVSRTAIPDGQWIIISVQDQGPGIPEDLQQKIFEPFYTTKRAGEGTGLGLSTAYGIAKQSGGYIFAKSLPTIGAEMEVWLPALASGTEATETPQSMPQHRRRSETPMGVILLVEDEEPVRAFAGRALRLHGHTVIEAAGADHALAILEDPLVHVDVIVTDVIMPGMDGPTWAQIAREKRPDIGVVFISGYAEDSVADHQSRISGAAFLAKPFSLNQLAEAVSKQLA
jgi:two-component system cell cycle sensor histidine kinase/response regulator CckA